MPSIREGFKGWRKLVANGGGSSKTTYSPTATKSGRLARTIADLRRNNATRTRRPAEGNAGVPSIGVRVRNNARRAMARDRAGPEIKYAGTPARNPHNRQSRLVETISHAGSHCAKAAGKEQYVPYCGEKHIFLIFPIEYQWTE
mmetsp:Transcript_54473/g.162787  ORF Transcript_54473/g.162787 Transcript_54473/m.162787 type:complete len:144 (+) Transcript_54473:203-634(+)